MTSASVARSTDAMLAAARQHGEAGRLVEAEAECRRVLQGEPSHAGALHLLGEVIAAAGRPEVALALVSRAITIEPDAADPRVTQGDLYYRLHRYDQALDCYARAAELAPPSARIHRRRGVVLKDLGRWDEALENFHRALELKPDDVKTLVHLAILLEYMNRLEESRLVSRKALEITPNHAPAHLCLGNAELSLGNLSAGLASYRRALAEQPDFAPAQHNMIFARHYDPRRDRSSMAEEARSWAARFAPAPGGGYPPHDNVPDPDRKLRIGYVSADFMRHPVGYFLESVIEAHDREHFEVFLFSTDVRYDHLSERLRQRADRWANIHGLTDDIAAAHIRREHVDILVDLSGHTAGARLELFARKPAPVQATWLGYFDTTGVQAIDYLIADRFVCPEQDERFYTERIVRLSHGYLCYRPQEFVEVDPLPALARGHATFGCFNKIVKLNDEVIALWARLLRAVPDARLMLKDRAFDEPGVREHLGRAFEREGIAAHRLTMAGRSDLKEYFAAYNEIDIALDPFPFNGGTTTVEGLWMGVPAITLAGDGFASRMGVSHLSTVGLHAFIAGSAAEYIEIARRASADLPSLAHLRTGLRQRLLDSPLCDGDGFTRGIEAAYRDMWREWCRSQARADQDAADKQAELVRL